VFLWVQKPVSLLILAGAVNGIILPLALTVILLAARKGKIVGTYRHPLWMTLAGWMVVIIMAWMGWITLKTQLAKLF
jgi:Mn2+/Fe2+ NRAMP family transporter